MHTSLAFEEIYPLVGLVGACPLGTCQPTSPTSPEMNRIFFMVNYIYGSHFIIILNKEWPPLFLANLYSDKLMYNSKSVLSQCNYIVVFCPSLVDSIMSQDRKTNTKYTFLFIVLFFFDLSWDDQEFVQLKMTIANFSWEMYQFYFLVLTNSSLCNVFAFFCSCF